MRFKDQIQREIYYRGQIDYCYWYISRIEFDSNFDALSKSKLTVQALRDIIRMKKRFGFDYTEDDASLKLAISKREKNKFDLKNKKYGKAD